MVIKFAKLKKSCCSEPRWKHIEWMHGYRLTIDDDMGIIHPQKHPESGYTAYNKSMVKTWPSDFYIWEETINFDEIKI